MSSRYPARRWGPIRKRTFARKVIRRSYGHSSPYSMPRGPAGSLKRGPLGFQWATLGYNEQFVASPATGSSDGYSFRCNSMFDPRFNTGGHQPQYFDQLTAMYYNWVVTDCEIIVRGAVDTNYQLAGTSALASVYNSMVCAAPYRSASGTIVSAAASDILEWPGTQAAPVAQNANTATVRLKIDIPKMLGIPRKAYIENPAFWGSPTADLATNVTVYAFVGAIASAAGGTANSTQIQATINYRAKFFNLLTIATS